MNSIALRRPLCTPGVQALCSKSQQAERTGNRVCIALLKRLRLPRQDNIAHIAPSVIFNNITNVMAVIDVLNRKPIKARIGPPLGAK